MFLLTAREQILIVSVLISIVLGVTVKHFRDVARVERPAAAAIAK